ncbi:zf-HC2 domain-containing protein [Clostridiaceae bacterium OttesenSCG-928-D20]|nr:zf-HC2 domain-containing protein [Clostridiaceae bacterium OttesenSCG-928-D20]
MKYSCDVIQDLLPLYHDGVCSDESRKMVDEHLPECEPCRTVLKQIENSSFDNQLRSEKQSVVGQFNKSVKRKSLTVGLTFAAVLAIPILVCLIVNLATGHALDWFFIVLCSLMVLASLTVVPLVVEERKLLWTITSFTASLILLLLVCSVYSGGGWFLAAATPTLLGMSVCFLPVVLYQLPLRGFAARHKGLIAMAMNTVLLYAVIAVSAPYSSSPDYWRVALLSTTLNALLPWALFAVIRYLKTSGLVKAGICTIITGGHITLLNDVTNWIIFGEYNNSLTSVDFSVWNDVTTNANSYLLIFIASCVVGGGLIAAGLLWRRKRSGEAAEAASN